MIGFWRKFKFSNEFEHSDKLKSDSISIKKYKYQLLLFLNKKWIYIYRYYFKFIPLILLFDRLITFKNGHADIHSTFSIIFFFKFNIVNNGIQDDKLTLLVYIENKK